MISEEEYLERMVAGIQAATTTGAEVTWNEVINRRQFDVVVRFRVGTMSYLVLVEVKNRSRKATAEDVDAFTTKAKDQLANKAVMVTAAGFQTGAIEVARRHGIDLFRIYFDDSEPMLPANASTISVWTGRRPSDVVPAFSVGEPVLAANITSVGLRYISGRWIELPREQSQLTYYTLKTILGNGKFLQDVIFEQAIHALSLGERVSKSVSFVSPMRIRPPDDYFFPAGEILSIRWEIEGVMSRPIHGNVRIDPSMFMSAVVYENALSGERSRFSPDTVPVSFCSIEKGKFYFIRHPLNYYYCDDVRQDLISWFLVESFQNGNLFQATFTQKPEWCFTYIPVSDEGILRRLRARLLKLQEHSQ